MSRPSRPGGPPLIPDAELARITTPSWLVTSRDDTTVAPQANTAHAHDLIPDSLMTLYDHVIWNGHQFPGHWSWIYVARNDPSINGTHIWQWMAPNNGADRKPTFACNAIFSGNWHARF